MTTPALAALVLLMGALFALAGGVLALMGRDADSLPWMRRKPR